MKKKEYKLSENAIKILDNIKIENKNSYEVIIIELNLIFQIEKSQKIKKCTYSSILIDNNYKSNRFILVFKKEEEIPKKGDIINVSQIKKYINEIDKEYIYECNEITFLAKEKDFVVDISKIQNYYKNENQIIEKQKGDIINNKNNGFEIQKNEDDDGEEEEEEEEEDDDNDEDINKDKKEKFNNNIIKNKINNFEEEKISEKNIKNNNKINLINKENDNKKDICINNIFENCQKYLLISDLDFNIQNFNIYLKCITKFEIKEFRYNKNKKYQNYIFTDIKNDMIEGVSFDFECEKFDKILSVNELYQVNNSFLKSNNKIYSKTDCPYKLFFTRHTAIFNVSNAEEIKNKFDENYNGINRNKNENINKNDFLKIAEITNKNIHNIINVFGFVLKDYGTFISFDQFNREFLGRKLLLGDDSNYKIIIVFWHPSDLKKVYEEGELLYIQNVKVGEYNGFKTLYGTKCRKIQNSFNFEYDNKLKKYFLDHKNINDYFHSKKHHNLNINDNAVNNSTRDKLIFIKDLLSMNNNKVIINNKINNSIFKISATVKSIRHSEKNYYYGCKNCKKKMINKICNNCGCKDKIIILHYSIRVVDSTGTLWLLFFGDIAKNFLGMSGEEYKNILDKGISYDNKEMLLLNKKFEDKEFIFIGKNEYYNYPNFQGYRFLVKFYCKKEKKEYYSLVNYLKNFLK